DGLDVSLVLLAPQRLQLRLSRQLRRDQAPIEYNFLDKAQLEAAGAPVGEWHQPFDLHGLSVFLRDGYRVFHTYSHLRARRGQPRLHLELPRPDPAGPAGAVGGAEGTVRGAGDRRPRYPPLPRRIRRPAITIVTDRVGQTAPRDPPPSNWADLARWP